MLAVAGNVYESTAVSALPLPQRLEVTSCGVATGALWGARRSGIMKTLPGLSACRPGWQSLRPDPSLARLRPWLPPDSRAGLPASKAPADQEVGGGQAATARVQGRQRGAARRAWGPRGRESPISGSPPGSACRSLSMKSVGRPLGSAHVMPGSTGAC